MKAFITKFAASIVATLCCFDRVIFRGYLPFGGDDHLNAFVDHKLQIRRKDFIPLLAEHSDALVNHAKAWADQNGRPYEYRQGKFRKETFIRNIIRDHAITEGLVAVLCCQETCRTVKLRHARRRPQLVFAYRPQRVLYYYTLDPEFWADVRATADLVSLHRSGLRQRARLAGPTTDASANRFLSTRQRVHAD